MSAPRRRHAAARSLGCALLFVSAFAQAGNDAPVSETRTGRDVYERFHDGLAEARCNAAEDSRWRRHYAIAADLLASHEEHTLPVFAHVVDALRRAHLPTEYALIPFIESGYRPQARSPAVQQARPACGSSSHRPHAAFGSQPASRPTAGCRPSSRRAQPSNT